MRRRPRGLERPLAILLGSITVLALWWWLRDDGRVLVPLPDEAAATLAETSASVADAPGMRDAKSGAEPAIADTSAVGVADPPPSGPVGQADATTSDTSTSASAVAPGLNDLEKKDAGKPAAPARLPRHWGPCFSAAGPNNTEYDLRSDFTAARSGKASAAIRSLVPRPHPSSAGFCQFIAAEKYRGKRVEFAAMLRTHDALPGAHLMVRADARDGRVLAFDMMRGAWVPGTNDWLRQSIVIDVPAEAVALMVGFGLVNVGAVWLDDASLTVVDPAWPLTQHATPPTHYTLAPDLTRLAPDLQNAGFEETRPKPGD
jgi:hypothetical protein